MTLSQRIQRFLLGGVLGYALSVAITKGLGMGLSLPVVGIELPGLGLPFAASYAISIAVLIIWGFLYNYYYNFKTDRPMRSAFVPYLAALVSSTFVNYLTALFCNYLAPAQPAFSVAAGMIFGGIFKFTLYHKFVFPIAKKAK